MNRRFSVRFSLILCLAGLVVIAILPIKALIYHSPDDAFFYLKTAWNFASGHGSTFDGMNPTNGYHPLWFLLLAALFSIGGVLGIDSPETFYRLSFAFQWALFSGTVFYIARLFSLRRNAGGEEQWNALAIPALLLFFLVFVRVVGSEAQVSVFVLAAFLFVKLREEETGALLPGPKALLLALLFLARIDYISNVVPALWLADALTIPGERRMRDAAVTAGTIAVAAIAYFGVNFTTYGHVLTVSASWKSRFPEFLLFQNIPYYLRVNPYQFARAVGAMAVCAIFVVAVFRKTRKERRSTDIVLAWLAVGSVAFLLQSMSFNAHKIREWYTSLPVFVAVLIVLRSMPAIRRIPVWVSVVSLVLAGVFFTGAGFAVKKWDANYDFARILERHVVENDPVMIVDCAGIVGYFSHVPVVNGDGLVNSFEYLDAVRQNKLGAWLQKKNIRWYATYSAVQPDSLGGKYIDAPVTGLGGLDFVFDSSQVQLRAPFSIDNIRYHSSGEWIVFSFASKQ